MDESSGEREARRARAGAVLAPLSALIVWQLPFALNALQQRLLAIVCAVVVAWVTEVVPIPVTALLIAPVMVACGITDAKTAFAPYADPLLFLFYGSFFMAAAMGRHGLDRRMARAIVSHRLIAGRPWRTRAALMLAGMALSMWISNTAATAILVPILLGTWIRAQDAQTRPQEQEAQTRPQEMAGSLLAVAYACSMGGVATLVGTPPNLIAVGLLDKVGVTLRFLDWLMIGLPTTLATVALTYGLFARSHPPPKVPAEAARPLRSAALSRGERVTALAFALAIVGWILPGLLSAAGAPQAEAVAAALPAGAVAMLASGLLFVLKDGGPRRQPVLPWQDAKTIDWGIIMLFGGGISLGKQMFDSGLANALGQGFIALTGVSDVWTLTGLTILFTIFFTEVCSNTATASMLIPLMIGVATELKVSPVPPVLGVALAASCAFMMPIATGPNAIVFATGRVPLSTMVRMGLFLNLACAALLFGLLRVLVPLYGWMD